MKRSLLVVGFGILIFLVACKSKESIQKVSEKQTQILTEGYWNAEDSRLVAEKLVKKMLADRWRTEYMIVHKNARPILIVGIVQNLSTAKIDTNLFSKDIEKSIIKGDLVRFVQSGKNKSILMKELANSDTINTISNWAQRMGANFVVNATINSTEETKRKEKIVLYRAKIELINSETQQPVWLGEEKINKKILLK